MVYMMEIEGVVSHTMNQILSLGNPLLSGGGARVGNLSGLLSDGQCDCPGVCSDGGKESFEFAMRPKVVFGTVTWRRRRSASSCLGLTLLLLGECLIVVLGTVITSLPRGVWKDGIVKVLKALSSVRVTAW